MTDRNDENEHGDGSPAQPQYGQAPYAQQYPQPQYGQAPYAQQYPQPQYGQAPYAQQYPQPQYGQSYPQGYPPYQKTNTLAIVAIILGFVVAPGGIICGHIALSQIKRTGENGRPLALTGLIAGYAITGLYLLFFIFYIVVIVALIGGAAGTSSPGFSS